MTNAHRRRLLLAASGSMCLSVHGAAWAGAYDEFFDAIRLDDPRGVRTWLLRGVDPNSPDPKEGPAIVAAARAKSFRAVQALLDSPETRVDASAANGETALMLVAMFGEVALAKLLVAKGAQVNREGWTPLHYAASSGNLPMVKYLLDESAYIDAESPNRTTPLMMAARQKSRSVVELLLSEGADPTVRNDAGLTAADYLQRNGETELAASMRKRAAEFDAKYRSAPSR